jgi:hypothetical protein
MAIVTSALRQINDVMVRKVNRCGHRAPFEADAASLALAIDTSAFRHRRVLGSAP